MVLVNISNTVEPPNNGHFGDNINSAVVSFVERLSSRRRFKMSIGKQIFGSLTCVLRREVYYTVFLRRRVHYRRFHCITTLNRVLVMLMALRINICSECPSNYTRNIL